LCSAARAANQDDFADQLVKTACNEESPAPSRAAALDAIGKLGEKGLGAATARTVASLKTLLPDPDGDPLQADFLRLHVVQALENIGAAARDALPGLASVETENLTLKVAIISAVTAVAKTDTEATSQPAADAPTAPTILGLRLDLASKSAPTRLAAIKGLQAQKEKALPVLADVAEKMKSDKEGDADVRRLAAEATKDILDTMPDGPAKDEWTRVYVDNLSNMLQGNDAQERRICVMALADLVSQFAKAGKTCPCAMAMLTAMENDKDPCVQAIAKVAMNPPKEPAPTDGQKKSTDGTAPQQAPTPKKAP
jgi:hypothetical protein